VICRNLIKDELFDEPLYNIFKSDRFQSMKEEIELLLDLVLSHKKDYLRDFLRIKDQPVSGTKDKLRQRLIENLESSRISDSELVRLLDQIEGSGNQHIYLQTCSNTYLSKLKQKDDFFSHLTGLGYQELYNREKSLLLPKEPTISSILHDDRWLKIKWVERRDWYELLSDEIEDGLRIKKYKPHVSRGITVFRTDLASGNAELMIQRLPRGTNYDAVRDRYNSELGRILDLNAFSLIDVGRSIRKIEDSGEVEKRSCNYLTVAGGRVAFRSRSRGSDYGLDPSLNRARSALGTNVSGVLGNFYWLPCSQLESKIHSHIYPNRVGIFGECTEQEVNYVLSRIRYFTQTTS